MRQVNELVIAGAVTMVVILVIWLTMFNSQIEHGETMEYITKESQVMQKIRDARFQCQIQCTTALSNNCAHQQLIGFCTLKTPIDLNRDKDTKDVNNVLFAGIPICEDAIYCPMLYECTCGKQLDTKNCKDIICDHYGSNGTQMLHQLWQTGSCDTSTENFWDKAIFGKPIEELTCE